MLDFHIDLWTDNHIAIIYSIMFSVAKISQQLLFRNAMKMSVGPGYMDHSGIVEAER